MYQHGPAVAASATTMLPFTGLNVIQMLVAGFTLIGAGFATRFILKRQAED